jgi:predicted metal-dependent peptidase
MTAAVDPTLRRNALSSKCNIPQDVLDEATRIFEEARQDLSLAEPVLAARIIRMCYPVFVDDSVVPTMAVTLDATRIVFLMINAEFICKIGRKGAAFVLCHEAYHDILLHLRDDVNDQTMTMAREIVINHLVRTNPTLKGMPTITDPATGKTEEVGVNDDKEYKRYREDLREQGKDAVDKATFVSSEDRCYTEMLRMKKPPKPPKKYRCSHESGDAGHGDLPLDRDALGEIIEEELRRVIEQAKAGDENARSEVEKLADSTMDSESASRIWGNVGLGALRGTVTEVKKTEYWRRWLTHVLASKLQPGYRLKQNRRLVAVDLLLQRDPQMGWIGDEERKTLHTYIDTSGSMYGDEVLEHVRNVVGLMDGVDARYYNFDTDIYDVVLGESFRGGGGTSFRIIEDHLAAQNDAPDLVLVITDGYAENFLPRDADKFVWLITPGGDEWPLQYGMRCETLDIDSMR